MPYFIGVLVPFGVTYIFNWVMFIATMIALGNRPNINKRQYQKWRENFWVAVVLSVLFGLGWSLGLPASNGIPRAFGVIFECAFTVILTAQGVFIFVVYCVKSKDSREFWKSVFLRMCPCCRGISMRAHLTTQSSNVGNTLSTKNGLRTATSPPSTLRPLTSTASSAINTSTLSPLKCSHMPSSFVSDASVIENAFTAKMHSIHEDTKPSNSPDDVSISLDMEKGKLCTEIELQTLDASLGPRPTSIVDDEDAASYPILLPARSAYATSAM